MQTTKETIITLDAGDTITIRYDQGELRLTAVKDDEYIMIRGEIPNGTVVSGVREHRGDVLGTTEVEFIRTTEGSAFEELKGPADFILFG